MANAKEIQSRIKSIEDTMKITSAMYMISSSKMKRAKKVLAETEPYFYGMQASIGRILRHMPEIDHIYFNNKTENKKPEEKKIGILVITADKGLAGAYNHNVIKMAEEEMQKPGKYKLYVLGMAGRQYFAKRDVDMDDSIRYTVQHPTMHRARSIAERVLAPYLQGDLDEVRIIYTEMESAVAVETKMSKLLPLKKTSFHTSQQPVDVHREEIAMVPSASAVLDAIIPNYVTGMIYGCLVESYASEHNSRMLAMEASTDNAKEMLRSLGIAYNRARQAAITQEITEVIGGAKAQKRK